MFVITETHTEALETVSTQAFIKRTDLHLRHWFPHHCQPLDRDQMRAVIHRGWGQAKSYHFTSEACVRSYLELMCLLGSDFDTDPLLPWAASILNEKCGDCQFSRGDKLHEKAWAYARHISRDYQRLLSSETVKPDGLAAAPKGLPDLVQFVKVSLRETCPAKCSYLGDDALLGAAARMAQSALAHGIKSTNGVTRFATMNFIFGSAFHKDPFLPWATAALNVPTKAGPDTRADDLHAKGLSFLTRMWNLSASKGRS